MIKQLQKEKDIAADKLKKSESDLTELKTTIEAMKEAITS